MGELLSTLCVCPGIKEKLKTQRVLQECVYSSFIPIVISEPNQNPLKKMKLQEKNYLP